MLVQNNNGYIGTPTPQAENLFARHTTPAARYEALKAEFPAILQAAIAHDRVRNENTFAAGITTNFLIQGAITKLGPQLAPLRAFCRDNSVDPFKPLSKCILKFNTTAQDGADVMTDATDFTGSDSTEDSTLEGPEVAVHQYTVPLHLTNAQLNSGARMADLIEAKLGSLKAKIAAVVTAPMTVANFPDPVLSAPDAFGFSDLATLQGLLKKSPIKNIILDGEYIARIANSPLFSQGAGNVGGAPGAWSAYGWNTIALLTEWAAAGPNVRGFACNPQAIGLISGLPLEAPANGVIATASSLLPGPDIAIQTSVWMDANARTMRATFDIMLGCVKLDTTAGRLITSA